MAEKIDAPMQDSIVVAQGWTVEFAAVDPVTGADVANVLVTNANVVGDDAADLGVTVGNPLLIGVSA